MSSDHVFARGELVYEHQWRGGFADQGRIYRVDGEYYAVVNGTGCEENCYGPCSCLVDALPAFNNNAVTAGTARIVCRELSPEQLLPMLNLYVADHPGFTINDAPYRVRNKAAVSCRIG